MLQVNTNRDTTFTSKLNVKPEAIKRNFFRDFSQRPQGIDESSRVSAFVFASPLKVKAEGVEEIIKKKAESKSAALLEYMKRKGKYLLSKMKEDWEKAINYKFLHEPEKCETDVILRFLFGK